MPAKRTHRSRAIPAQYVTGSARRAAIARDEYVWDLDGAPPHFVIRKQGTGEIVEHCPTVTHSEVEERVAILNRGNPTRAENQSWGKLTKERGRPGKGVKSAEAGELSVTEWFERLAGDPVTSETLRDYTASGRSMSIQDVEELLFRVGGMPAVDTDEAMQIWRNLVEAISMQLYRKLGIHRAEGTRRADT